MNGQENTIPEEIAVMVETYKHVSDFNLECISHFNESSIWNFHMSEVTIPETNYKYPVFNFYSREEDDSDLIKDRKTAVDFIKVNRKDFEKWEDEVWAFIKSFNRDKTNSIIVYAHPLNEQAGNLFSRLMRYNDTEELIDYYHITPEEFEFEESILSSIERNIWDNRIYTPLFIVCPFCSDSFVSEVMRCFQIDWNEVGVNPTLFLTFLRTKTIDPQVFTRDIR